MSSFLENDHAQSDFEQSLQRVFMNYRDRTVHLANQGKAIQGRFIIRFQSIAETRDTDVQLNLLTYDEQKRPTGLGLNIVEQRTKKHLANIVFGASWEGEQPVIDKDSYRCDLYDGLDTFNPINIHSAIDQIGGFLEQPDEY